MPKTKTREAAAASPTPSKPICKLRRYQCRSVEFATHNYHSCVEEPTGGGKTIEIAATALALIQDEVATHAVVATLYEHIEDAFKSFPFGAIRYTSKVPPRIVPDKFIRASRDLGKSRATIAAYVRDPAPQKHIVVATHAAMQPDLLPRSTKGMILFVDEAQASAAKLLSEVVREWVFRGGMVKFFTGTAYRGDGKPVIWVDGMAILRRPLAVHMEEGYAPGSLVHSIVPFNGVSHSIRQFLGDEAPDIKDVPVLTEAMTKAWVADGRPKLVIHVPPLAGGSKPLIDTLIEHFERLGARVVSAYGYGTQIKHGFNQLLLAERGRKTHDLSQVDVIIGSGRVVTGMDWMQCAAGYIFGLPSSATKVMQFLGRTARPKDDGHPHKDRMILRFFVPSEGVDLKSLQLRHSKDALAVCALIADTATPGQWAIETAIVEGVERYFDGLDDDPKAKEALHKILGDLAEEAPDHRKSAEVKAKVAAAQEQNPTAAVGEVLDELFDPESQDVAAEQMLKLLQPSLGADERKQQSEQIASVVARGIAAGFPISAIKKSVFDSILPEFRAHTLEKISLRGLRQQVHVLTGETATAFAKRIFPDDGPNLTEDIIAEDGARFYKKHSRWPNPSDESLGLAGDTWASRERALRVGRRGLGGGRTLMQVFQPDHTPKRIIGWAIKHAKKFGALPGERSTDFSCLPVGESWNAINVALGRGLRGLPGESSLYKLYKQHGLLDQYDIESGKRWKK